MEDFSQTRARSPRSLYSPLRILNRHNPSRPYLGPHHETSSGYRPTVTINFKLRYAIPFDDWRHEDLWLVLGRMYMQLESIGCGSELCISLLWMMWGRGGLPLRKHFPHFSCISYSWGTLFKDFRVRHRYRMISLLGCIILEAFSN